MLKNHTGDETIMKLGGFNPRTDLMSVLAQAPNIEKKSLGARRGEIQDSPSPPPPNQKNRTCFQRCNFIFKYEMMNQELQVWQKKKPVGTTFALFNFKTIKSFHFSPHTPIWQFPFPLRFPFPLVLRIVGIGIGWYYIIRRGNPCRRGSKWEFRKWKVERK